MGKLRLLTALGGIVLPCLLALSRAAPSAAPDAPHVRRPVALGQSADGKRLFVANRSGSVSVLDPAARRVVAEVAVGKRLADLAVLADGKLLAADEAAGEIV